MDDHPECGSKEFTKESILVLSHVVGYTLIADCSKKKIDSEKNQVMVPLKAPLVGDIQSQVPALRIYNFQYPGTC